MLDRFVGEFRVPKVAIPWLDAIVTAEEMALVRAASRTPLTIESVQQALNVPAEASAGVLDRAFRRGVLDRTERDHGPTYTPTDFYTRLDYFATFDNGWDALPLEARHALDDWMMEEYLERVRPNVERLKAGLPAEGSPGNDSVLLLEELDTVIDAARTITAFPCNCRRLGMRCGKPVETCVQFDAEAEKKLARGYGRRLTAPEAKELLAWADRKGLMHTTDLEFGEDGPSPICNCCADDCYVFRAAERLESKGAWPKIRHMASFDEKLCQMCGACTIRCPFGAFHHDGTLVEIAGLQVRRVAFDPQNCRGCGLCAATCLTGAIAMTQLPAKK